MALSRLSSFASPLALLLFVCAIMPQSPVVALRYLAPAPVECRRQLFRPASMECAFVCPPRSCMKAGLACISSIEDCECRKGFVLVDNSCVPESEEEPLCVRQVVGAEEGCNLTCPEHSCVKPVTSCVADMSACACKRGYYMSGTSCVPFEPSNLTRGTPRIVQIVPGAYARYKIAP